MSQAVKVKGYGRAVFPDHFTKEQMRTALRKRFNNAAESTAGALDAAATVGSAVVAEPVSGLAGIGSSIYNMDASKGADTVKAVQDAMTYQPRTAKGQEYLQNVSDFVEPVANIIGSASQNLGDKAYEATGSPTLATAAYSVPTAIAEGLGLKGLSIAKAPTGSMNLSTARSGFGSVTDTPREITSTPVDWGGKFQGERMQLDSGHIDVVSANNGLSKYTIMEFFTDEPSRGKGIGGKLLDEAVKKYGRDLGAQFSSKESVAAAHNRGFRPQGEYSGATKQQLMDEVASGNSVFMRFTDGVEGQSKYKPKGGAKQSKKFSSSVTLQAGADGAKAFREIRSKYPNAEVTSRNADGTITVGY